MSDRSLNLPVCSTIRSTLSGSMANKGLFREYDALAYNKDGQDGPGDRHRAINHVKKGKKGSEVVFNPQDHKEFLTGFRKRKLQRRKVAQKQLEVKAKQQRVEERLERRTKLKQELGLPDDYGVGSSSSDDEPEVDIKEDERAQVTVYNDGEVTTRVSVVDLGAPGVSSDDEAGISGHGDDDQPATGGRKGAQQPKQRVQQQQQQKQQLKPAGKKSKLLAKKGAKGGSKSKAAKKRGSSSALGSGSGSLTTKHGKMKKR